MHARLRSETKMCTWGLQRKARTLKNFLDELNLGELLELFELHRAPYNWELAIQGPHGLSYGIIWARLC